MISGLVLTTAATENDLSPGQRCEDRCEIVGDLPAPKLRSRFTVDSVSGSDNNIDKLSVSASSLRNSAESSGSIATIGTIDPAVETRNSLPDASKKRHKKRKSADGSTGLRVTQHFSEPHRSEAQILDALSLQRQPLQQPRGSFSAMLPKPIKKIASFLLPSDADATTTRSKDVAADNAWTLSSAPNYTKTMDRLPTIEYYRSAMSVKRQLEQRPTLADLLGLTSPAVNGTVTDIEAGPLEGKPPVALANEIADKALPVASAPRPTSGPKFGWIKGVLIRCFLNILGVMLFLRLSWITGQAGIGLATVIVLLASVVSLLTAISMCAICTNGEVKGGGVYFLISRSLGPEFGGSIGIVFSFANAVAVAMHIVGFAETVRDLIKEHGGYLVDQGINDIRVIGIITVVCLLGICMIGLELEAVMQVGLLVVLLVAIFNYVIGAVLPPSVVEQEKGITGLDAETFNENFFPAFRGESFITLFAIFFPSVTGIAAGANISGDLKDPQKAIPKGTLLAILVTDIVYILFIWLSGSTVIRDASGLPFDNATFVLSSSIIGCGPLSNESCKYGLMNYFQVMELDSGYGPIITAGIFAATLSSALACLVSAPKIFQAVCNDKIYPKIDYFAKPYGKHGEPKRAYLLAFVISLGIILIGDLNVIAPIISNFYLASYALINYACFDAVISNVPGFRPSFRYFNKWLALLGALLCAGVMFVMSWQTALATALVVAVLYLYIRKRKPDINWGSSTQANTYKQALKLMHRLQHTPEHVKTYRPQVMVLTGNPTHRPLLVDFVSSITKDTSLMMCGHVFYTTQDDVQEHATNLLTMVQEFRSKVWSWLAKRRVKSFYGAVIASGFREGVHTLVQTAGIGRMRPNVLFLGFKNNWRDSTLLELNDYYETILDAFSANLAVGILRLSEGLDFKDLLEAYNINELSSNSQNQSNQSKENGANFENQPSTGQPRMSMSSLDSLDDSVGDFFVEPVDKVAQETKVFTIPRRPVNNKSTETTFGRKLRFVRKVFPCAVNSSTDTFGSQEQRSPVDLNTLRIRASSGNILADTDYKQTQMGVVSSMNRFRQAAKNPVIDVWWLADDGGLTLLIPYLLATNRCFLQGAQLRVFALASNTRTLQQEQHSLTTLLHKFRIDAADVEVISDADKTSEPESQNEFRELIAPFLASKDDPSGEPAPGLISESELSAMQDKTNRIIRTRELVLERSSSASLIVITLPVPKKGLCSGALYLAWLDYLTRDLPPVLLIRGNQQSVLTFYS